jgi:hypothetical protein
MRRLLLSTLLLLLPAFGQAKELILPMHRDRTGQLSVSLTINGRSARLLVDTGANLSTMDIGRVRAFIPDGKVLKSAAPGAPPQVDLPVTYNGQPIGEEQFTLVDLRFINVGAERMGTPPFDGRLGASFFERYHAVIDFPAMTIRLDLSTSANRSGTNHR